MSLDPIQLDTSRVGPANTRDRHLGFTDRISGRFGTWYHRVDSDSVVWRVGTEFGAITFAGVLDGSTFHARVRSAGDIEPDPTEIGHVRAERIRCPGDL